MFGKGLKTNPRLKIWGIAFSIWKRNILVGAGKFPVVYLCKEVSNNFKMQVLTHAHNVYLQVLVTNGIVGLLGFLNLFLAFFKELLNNVTHKKNKYYACLFAVFTAYFIEGFFECFWSDSEVRYLLLYFLGFTYSSVLKSR